MNIKKVALIGGGPSALSILKKSLIRLNRQKNTKLTRFEFSIFERNNALGKGMPYSKEGASSEHITNVSSDELAPFDETLLEWLSQQSDAFLGKYNIARAQLHEKHVVPRLLFGEYLQAQFIQLLAKCNACGLTVNVHANCNVLDIKPNGNDNRCSILTQNGWMSGFDNVVVCTGHTWPKENEDKISGFYDSPYPPQKLQQIFNHPVALKGSSLTAIDAIRSLSAANGEFYHCDNQLKYRLSSHAPNFKMVMHSLEGLLPNIRFHLDEPLVSDEGMLSDQHIALHRASNDGFLSIDFIFEHNFKKVLQKRAPHFYQKITDKSIEEFCDWMLKSRKAYDPFTLFKIEYLQAEQSIKDEHAVQWKEVLALLSFTINHPAKYFCAEDTLRLRNHLLPLIGLMIANIPQSSAQQLLALFNAGVLDIIRVDSSSHVSIEGANNFKFHYKDKAGKSIDVPYRTFIDCTGQKSLPMTSFPFKSMFEDCAPIPARVQFKDKKQAQRHLQQAPDSICKGSDGEFYLETGGFAINDDFQPILTNASINARYFIMAVPYIGGFNPDYSGFDFCEQVAEIIVAKLETEV